MILAAQWEIPVFPYDSHCMKLFEKLREIRWWIIQEQFRSCRGKALSNIEKQDRASWRVILFVHKILVLVGANRSVIVIYGDLNASSQNGTMETRMLRRQKKRPAHSSIFSIRRVLGSHQIGICLKAKGKENRYTETHVDTRGALSQNDKQNEWTIYLPQ